MKILFIDDDRDDQEFYCLAAARISPSVVCEVANDGEEGIEKLSSSLVLPELVVLDINMPRMNGWETLQVIRDTPRLQSLDVVVCSTSSGEADRKRSATFGAAFITKANNLNQIVTDLSTIIKDAINTARARQAARLAF